MTSRSRRLAALPLGVALGAALALACGAPSKHDLLERAEGVDTKQALEESLGDPDDRTKLGPLETWTYDASDGTVTFLITGNTVQLESTGPARARD